MSEEVALAVVDAEASKDLDGFLVADEFRDGGSRDRREQMPDVTVKRVEEMEAIWGGSFVRARASLGATSFGMNIACHRPEVAARYPDRHQDRARPQRGTRA